MPLILNKNLTGGFHRGVKSPNNHRLLFCCQGVACSKHKLMVLTFHFDGVVGKTSPDLRVLLVSSTMERKHCNHNIYTFTHHEPFQTF